MSIGVAVHGGIRDTRDFWPKMAFLGLGKVFWGDRQVTERETVLEPNGNGRITKRLVGKRKKAGVMTTPAFLFTRG